MPSRRPRSRSEQNGEPPTGVSTSEPPPSVTARSGLRPRTENVSGALASISMMNSRSHRTRVPSTFWPRREQFEGVVVAHLGADLLEDRHRPLVDQVELFLGQDRARWR